MNPRRSRARPPHVQVDLSPSGADFRLSIGMLSLWVTRTTARKLITGLADALIASARGARLKPRGRRLLDSKAEPSTCAVTRFRLPN